MDYKIVPNFLPKDIYNFYLDYFFGSKQMTYEYVDVIGHQEDKSGFFFTRDLYDKETKLINQKLFLLSTPLLFYSKITKPIRIKVNCFIKQPTHILSAPHVDKSFPHKVFLYSINTNNGFTILDPNGKNIKIPSVGNQALFFDGNLKHQAVTQTDENIRVNININYLV